MIAFVDNAGDFDFSLCDISDAEVDGEMGRRGLDTGSEVEDVVATSMSWVFSTFTREVWHCPLVVVQGQAVVLQVCPERVPKFLGLAVIEWVSLVVGMVTIAYYLRDRDVQ